MAEQTSSSIRITAPASDVMAAIADFDSYPHWATGVKETEVEATGDDGRAERVRFVLNAPPIKDEYRLSYTWDDDRQVRWTLVDAKVLKAMDGVYELSATDDSTEVTYRLAVDVAIPMIGLLKNKAEKVIIDAALKGLKQRVESSSPQPWH